MDDLKKATSVWKLFHKKSSPRELIDIAGDPWPEKWAYAGEARTTYYRSDKWQDDGDYAKYYHEHEGGVSLWHPSGLFDWLDENRKQPSIRIPKAVAVLGYAVGVEVKRHDTGKVVQAYPERSSYLICSPNGRVLWIIEPSGGVAALICGKGLHVEPCGIVG